MFRHYDIKKVLGIDFHCQYTILIQSFFCYSKLDSDIVFPQLSAVPLPSRYGSQRICFLSISSGMIRNTRIIMEIGINLFHNYFEKHRYDLKIERIKKYCAILQELNQLSPLVDGMYSYMKEKKGKVKELKLSLS